MSKKFEMKMAKACSSTIAKKVVRHEEGKEPTASLWYGGQPQPMQSNKAPPVWGALSPTYY